MCLFMTFHLTEPIIHNINLTGPNDYLKIDIPSMVAEFIMTEKSKEKLHAALEKFPTLFGDGLGRLSTCNPAKIKLKKKGSKLYTGRYYNFPKANVKPSKKDVK